MAIDPLTFVSFDTETTGLSFENDRIIQFGYAVFVRGSMVHRENIYIQTAVPNSGYEINGITDEQIANGQPPGEVFASIAAILGPKSLRRVCIYNAPFDLSFLANEFRRNGIQYDFSDLQILDPLVMARRYFKYRPCKLTDMADRMGIPLPDAHDAAADSEAAGHVYIKMRERYSPLRDLYINKLLARWHDDWAADFMTWYYGKYGQFPEIQPWPVRPDWMANECSLQSELF